jgi:predicted DNA-binding transcriptional regulator AlpA
LPLALQIKGLELSVAAASPKKSTKLIDRQEVLRRVPVSFVTLWHWMRAGTFPRSRDIGGKSAWVEAEVEAWIRNRPVRPLKGDAAR